MDKPTTTNTTTIYFSCLPRASSGCNSDFSGFIPENKFSAAKSNLNFDSSKVTPCPDYLEEAGSLTFSQELLRAQEQERQNLADELHDNLGQSLILLKNQVLKMKNNLPEKTETLGQLNTLADMVTASLQKVRDLSYVLRPYELNLLGLTQALKGLLQVIAAQVPWSVKLDLPVVDQFFAPEKQIYVYRVIQECLSLIQKQESLSEVCLLAYPRQTSVVWEIHVSGPDNFFAFLADNFLKNYDLLRLQEHLKFLEGTITFTAAASRTTIMQINTPISSAYMPHEKA